MSNFLAVATVTATLSRLLQAAVGADVPGATVTTLRPNGSPGGTPTTGVNVFLFQVMPNAAWRNADLPTRNGDGDLSQRPRAALELNYLISFYGNEAQFEPQRLLGSVVRTLHARPALTVQAIRQTVASPSFPFLAPSDLGDEIERVRFTPLPLSLEELSKLWSVFFQTPYALSVAYAAGVVLIEGEAMPRAAMAVRERNIYLLPFTQPVVEAVTSAGGAAQPIVAGATLSVAGRGLRGEFTRVRAGGAVASLVGEPADTRLTVSLPPGLRAGVQGLQVVHERLIGTPPTPHAGAESNVAAFVLRPTITSVGLSGVQGTGAQPRSATLTVQVNPPVGSGQRVELLLNEVGATPPPQGPSAHSFAAPPRAVDTAAVAVPIAGVRAGQYAVRLRVDGAESLLAPGAGPGQPPQPSVTIP